MGKALDKEISDRNLGQISHPGHRAHIADSVKPSVAAREHSALGLLALQAYLL